MTDEAASSAERRWLAATGEVTARRYVPDVVVGGTVFVCLLLLVVADWEPLLTFDRNVVRSVHAVFEGSDVLMSTARALTSIGGGEVSSVLLISAVLWFLVRGAARPAAFVAVSGLGALIFDEGVKALVGRLRPVVDIPIAAASGPSFPSGHTLNVTITFGVLLLVVVPLLTRRGRGVASAAAVATIVVVGLTRVALGVHYLSDVVAGWGLGVVWVASANRAVVQAAPRRRSPPTELVPAPGDSPAFPDGWMSVARLVSGAVLIWGALLAAGLLVSDPDQIAVEIDRVVLEWMVSIRGPVLTEVMAFVGRLGGTAGIVTALVLISTAAVAALRRWHPALFVVVAVAGETALFLATVTIVERARPESALIQEFPPTTSFPSGHVAAAAAMYGSAALLVWFHRRDWAGAGALIGAACIVLGVAFSRLYEGAHFLTDAIASLTYVAVWLTICWKVIRPSVTRPPGMTAASRER